MPTSTPLDARNIPADYGDAAGEYRQAVDGAAIFDCSQRGKLELTGPEAPNFLHNLSTNDVLNLPLGGGCEAFFTTSTAKIVDHALIYHLRLANGQDAIWLDVAPGRAAPLLQHLERFHIAENFEIADRTGEFAQIHLAGPKAKEVLSRAIGEAIPDLAEGQNMERTLGAQVPCNIRRNDALGVPGFDLVCRNERGAEVWEMLVTADAKPAGATAYEWLRVEAGTPILGIDMNDTRFVLETGRMHAVSYEKGCYLGQEPIVMARDRAGHVNRSFRGLLLGDGPPAPANSKLFNADGKEAGVTTSSVISPRFGPIALGYIRRGSEGQDVPLFLDTPGGRSATVTTLPFTETKSQQMQPR